MRTHGKRFGLIADGIHTTKTARQCELQYKKWARTADPESVEMAETLAPSRAAPKLVTYVRRREQWPESDNQKLMGLVLEHGIDWSKLAEAMGRGRTHVQKHVRDLYTRTKQTEWKYQIEAAEIIGEYYESNKKQVIDKQQAAAICAAVLEVGAVAAPVFAKLNGSIPLKQLRKYIQNHNLKRVLESYQRVAAISNTVIASQDGAPDDGSIMRSIPQSTLDEENSAGIKDAAALHLFDVDD